MCVCWCARVLACVCVLACSTLPAVSLRINGAQQLHQVQRMIGGIGNMLFSTCSQTLNGKDPRVSFGEPLGHVITLRGPFMASRTLAIRDRPNIMLR